MVVWYKISHISLIVRMRPPLRGTVRHTSQALIFNRAALFDDKTRRQVQLTLINQHQEYIEQNNQNSVALSCLHQRLFRYSQKSVNEIVQALVLLQVTIDYFNTYYITYIQAYTRCSAIQTVWLWNLMVLLLPHPNHHQRLTMVNDRRFRDVQGPTLLHVWDCIVTNWICLDLTRYYIPLDAPNYIFIF